MQENQNLSNATIGEKRLTSTAAKNSSVFLLIIAGLLIISVVVNAYFLMQNNNTAIISDTQIKTTITPTAQRPSAPDLSDNSVYLPVLLNTKDKVLADVTTNLKNGTDIVIPNTNIQFTLPASYNKVTNKVDVSLGNTPRILSFAKSYGLSTDLIYQCISDASVDLQSLVQNYSSTERYLADYVCPGISKDFSSFFDTSNVGGDLMISNNLNINLIETNLSAQKWAEANITIQGQKWSGTMEQVKINNFTYSVFTPSCCGGHEKTYMMPITGLDNKKYLLAFNTDDFVTVASSGERNAMLELILGKVKTK